MGIIVPIMGVKNEQHINLSDAIFSKTQQQVLGLLFGNPTRSYYLNEIVRAAGIGIGTVQRELAKLSAAGLVTVRKIGNQKHYQANPATPIFAELCGIIQKTCGIADKLKAALVPVAEKIDFCFIFGSVAQGRGKVSSDIDLFVIGDIEFVALVGALADTQEKLGGEINPVLMAAAEFIEKYTESDRFVRRVMNEEKIFVKGDEHDLGKLVGNRPTERASGE